MDEELTSMSRKSIQLHKSKNFAPVTYRDEWEMENACLWLINWRRITFSSAIVVAALFQSVSYEGKNRRYVYINLPRPTGLSVFGSQLYWADASLEKVASLNFLSSL